MAESSDMRIRVIRTDDLKWDEVPCDREEKNPPGEVCVLAQSRDDSFSFGFWKRGLQNRHFERTHHEVAFIIEGELEVVDDDGAVHHAGPGDVVITPEGSRGSWKNLSPVKKVWGIYKEADRGLDTLHDPGDS